MTTERNVVDFKIHNLTEEQFQELKDAGQIDPNAVYCTPDDTKERVDALEINKQDKLTAGAGITISENTISATGLEVPIDSELSSTSVNPVQNKVITSKISEKANDSDVVHKTGKETIGGPKTFTSNTIWKKEDWDATQNPTSNKFATWSQVCDTSDTMMSYAETAYLENGTVQQSLGARKVINGTQYTANIRTRVDASGNTFVELGSNPASSSNGTQVATTYWANAKFLPLAGGTITGNIVTSGQYGYAFGNGAKIRNSGNNNTNLTIFLKDSDWKQSYIGLESGQFVNCAADGTNVLYLIGKSDGTLTWNGKNIALDANVLHKTGNETITGAITTKSQILFEHSSSTGYRGFLYMTSDGALSMGLNKSDFSGWQSYQSLTRSGQYLMNVSDGTNSKVLSAKSDGTLTWDGKQIVRLVEEQKATADNNHAWYRKYSDGWVEQGGIHHRGSAGDTVNLPIAMSNEYYELQLTAVNPTNITRYAFANTYTSTYFKCGTADDQSPNNDGDIRWYVCGYAA